MISPTVRETWELDCSAIVVCNAANASVVLLKNDEILSMLDDNIFCTDCFQTLNWCCWSSIWL